MPGLIPWLLLPGLLLAGWAWAAPSQPPLVPEGERFEDMDALIANISGHLPISSVAFSLDGRLLASGGG